MAGLVTTGCGVRIASGRAARKSPDEIALKRLSASHSDKVRWPVAFAPHGRRCIECSAQEAPAQVIDKICRVQSRIGCLRGAANQILAAPFLVATWGSFFLSAQRPPNVSLAPGTRPGLNEILAAIDAG